MIKQIPTDELKLFVWVASSLSVLAYVLYKQLAQKIANIQGKYVEQNATESTREFFEKNAVILQLIFFSITLLTGYIFFPNSFAGPKAYKLWYVYVVAITITLFFCFTSSNLSIKGYYGIQ